VVRLNPGFGPIRPPLAVLFSVVLLVASCGLQHIPTRYFVQNSTSGSVVVRTTGRVVSYFEVPAGAIREIPDDPDEAIAIFDAQCHFLSGTDSRGDTPRFITDVVSAPASPYGYGGNGPPPQAPMAEPSDIHC
jgi:hypothetical protein